jgi:hypothetical protein
MLASSLLRELGMGAVDTAKEVPALAQEAFGLAAGRTSRLALYPGMA